MCTVSPVRIATVFVFVSSIFSSSHVAVAAAVVAMNDCIEQDSLMPNRIDHIVHINQWILNMWRNVIRVEIGECLVLVVDWSVIVEW